MCFRSYTPKSSNTTRIDPKGLRTWRQSKNQSIDSQGSSQDFRLAVIGYEVGIRMHLLFVAKEKLMQRRESRLLSILYYLHDTLYRFIFGKAADSLEMSNDSPDECKTNICFKHPANHLWV